MSLEARNVHEKNLQKRLMSLGSRNVDGTIEEIEEIEGEEEGTRRGAVAAVTVVAEATVVAEIRERIWGGQSGGTL